MLTNKPIRNDKEFAINETCLTSSSANLALRWSFSWSFWVSHSISSRRKALNFHEITSLFRIRSLSLLVSVCVFLPVWLSICLAFIRLCVCNLSVRPSSVDVSVWFYYLVACVSDCSTVVSVCLVFFSAYLCISLPMWVSDSFSWTSARSCVAWPAGHPKRRIPSFVQNCR